MASEAVILLTCERDMYAYPPKSNTQDHRISQMWLRLPTEMALAFRNKTSVHTDQQTTSYNGTTCRSLQPTHKTAALMKTSGMMWFHQATKVSADKQGHAAGTCVDEALQEHATAACTHSSMCICTLHPCCRHILHLLLCLPTAGGAPASAAPRLVH